MAETAKQRRQSIMKRLESSTEPVTAAALSREMSVTRQVIVGDIALLRAEGCRIIATPRGYLTEGRREGAVRQLACCHSAADTREELFAMVDCGCTVLDVTVEHPVYGQITAPLRLSSRYDVDEFIRKMNSANAAPLSALTEGIHLHALSCPNDAAFEHLRLVLAEKGFLLPEHDG